MSKKTTFRFTVDGGPEKTIKVKSGIYINAVAAIPAFLDLSNDDHIIKIWVSDLLPDYGPYFYRVEYNGGIVISPTIPL